MKIKIDITVSTHASAREATPHGRRRRRLLPRFNSRFREGSDSLLHSPRYNTQLFQLTLPRGKRLNIVVVHRVVVRVSTHASAREATRTRCATPWSWSSFNSRFREGSDEPVAFHFHLAPVSTHASAREATSQGPPSLPTPGSFNSRFREGSDQGRSARG